MILERFFPDLYIQSIYDLPLAELTRVARRRTFRALSSEERRAHLLAVNEEDGRGQ